MASWVVVGGFIGVTVLAAARLLVGYRESRELPELLIATLILGVGTLGVGGGFVIAATTSPGALRTVLGFVPMTGVSVGMSALAVFTWRVYRPDERVAQLAAGFLVVSLVGLLAWPAAHGTTEVLAARPIAIFSSVLHVSTMAWSAVEALVYWRAMQRRLALGLADALVTNRFLLWGLATGTAAQGIAIGAIARLVFDAAPNASWITLCYAAHGSLTAIFFWLAFAPPGRYESWVRGEAA